MILKNYEWLRVSKNNPCVICSKPDWCTFQEDGSACCMRIMSSTPMKNGGYFHRSEGNERTIYNHPFKKEIKPSEDLDAQSLWEKWNKQLTPKSLIIHSEKLGVDPMALKLLGCVWAYPHNAWAFPMKNHLGKIIGIRLRNELGQKWAVKGSKQGLFIPDMSPSSKTLFVVEGPTDCSACLSLGFYSIGRPACVGCEDFIQLFCRENKIKEVVIVADNDMAGINGAEKLKAQLKFNSCLLILPTKDIREFFINGGTKTVIESMIKNLIWNKK